MNKQITSQVFTISEFFNHYKDYQFVIPIYQRKYEWGKEQCETLFNDLLYPDIKGENGEYLLGNIMFEIEDNKIYIIDGQQRLTSLVLLLSAMRKNGIKIDDVYLEYNKNEPRLISERSDTEEINSLENIILKQNDNEYKDSTICRNYKTFLEKIDSENAQIILTNLQKHIKIVAINLGSSKVQTVFEKANSTGKPLSEVALIRNYTLMGVKTSEQKELSEKYWKVMEDEIKWENGEQIGLRIDYILSDFTVIELELDVRNINQSLYDRFKCVCKNEKYHGDMFKIMRDVLEVAYHWGRLSCENYDNKLFVESDEKLKLLFEDLNYNGGMHHYIPFIKMYRLMNYRENFKREFSQIAHKLDSYWVRKYAKRHGRNPGIRIRNTHLLSEKTINKIFDEVNSNNYSFIEYLWEWEENTGAGQYKSKGDCWRYYCYDDYDSYDNIKPEDNWDFHVTLLKKGNNDVFNSDYDILGWFLKKLIHKLTRKDVSNYSIEHIAPQTPKNDWIKMLNKHNENKKEYDVLINELGNLTLLTSREDNNNKDDNKSLGNKNFNEKLRVYKDDKYKDLFNTIFMNDVIDKTEWTADDIVKRTENLADLLVNIWSLKEYPKNLR